MSIFDWWLYWILMAIPIVNVIVFLIVLFSSETSRSLKNMLWAQLLIVVIVVALFATVLAPIWQQYLPEIQTLIEQIRQLMPF
jgi:sensor histidine kinase regulating citrate/malate metabolism